MSWAILTPSYYEPALAVAPAPDSAVDPSSAASPAWVWIHEIAAAAPPETS